REKVQSVFRRLSTDPVGIRVHDVIIRGNAKTRDELIEAEVADLLRSATTVQDLLSAAADASARLRGLDVFEAVNITLDAGPPELPGTTNVVIEVVEPAIPLSGNAGVYSKPEAKAWSVEGAVKWKNLAGYADIWDASVAYGFDQTTEVGVGVSLPRFKSIPTPLMARASLLSQDWMKFSSYKERLLGLSLGLLSTRHHDLSYNLTWRSLTDPSRLASTSIRRQLGHNLLSALKYTYKIDQRDSHIRPTKGYAFLSSSQVGGLWDNKGLKFFRQEFDVRAAVPFGFWNAALNVGVGAGVILPLARGFMNSSTPVTDRFNLGGHNSPVCSLGGISSLLGFRTRGVGPTEPRRLVPGESEDGSPAVPGRDYLGGDLAVSAFADLSFDLPLKVLRDAGIHGHAFLTAGNLAKLSEGQYKNFSLDEFRRSFRSTAGVGIILPTKLFRVEVCFIFLCTKLQIMCCACLLTNKLVLLHLFQVNYCYILKQSQHDSGKTGIQFSFSSP
uniref:Bacterial surface antigen (D15) domain-containing protein n=1 Tax=Aegilops tauschii subsp. strangulata TaxID=200361 RepID=A0A452ZBZ7_AEGTS